MFSFTMAIVCAILFYSKISLINFYNLYTVGPRVSFLIDYVELTIKYASNDDNINLPITLRTW